MPAELHEHVHKEIINPRFDIKVSNTTRGWTWEYEIKDCPDIVTANRLQGDARAAIRSELVDGGLLENHETE